ncbi:MAG: nitroreductase family protein [Planctomycetota bacterium]|jgi:nitroreductase
MDFFEAVSGRYSCRDYQDRPVEEETLTQILEAARLAPSASNRQEWRFIVVTDAAVREKLIDMAHKQEFVGQAPVVLVACAVTDGHTMACGQSCHPIDVAIALEHIALAATALGLGTCWIGAFEEAPVKKLLGIPPEVRVIELMPLGYPADKPRPKTRLPLEEIRMSERWEA